MKLRAKNSFGVLSEINEIKFAISPPGTDIF